MKSLTALIFTLAVVSFLPNTTQGHCDRMNGPVAKAARQALENGDFESIQIWLGKEQQQELRQSYQRALDVYQQKGTAGKLAERYFIENAVRLHRAAEGMPFTGVKPAQPLPEDLKVAEKALKSGNADKVTGLLKKEIEQNVNKWHRKAVQAKKNKDESVEAGREWVDAYVKYIIYVHKLHQKIQAGPPHGVGE